MKKNKTMVLAVAAVILGAVVIGEMIGLFVMNAKIKKLSDPQAALTAFTKGVENVYVQVRIKKETKDGMFTDSIYYPADEWFNKTPEEVQSAVQGRVDNWLRVTSGNK